MQTQAKFLLDSYVIENSYHDDLYQVLTGLGYEVICDRYTPMQREATMKHYDDADCVVLYGSMSFVEQHQRNRCFVPGAYYTKDRYLCSEYMSRLPLDILANNDYVMVPFAEFVRRREQFYKMFNANKIFVRPNSGFKTFTGLPIHEDEFDYEVNTLRSGLTSTTDQTMVLVASCKRIEKEYRFFIVNGKVITGSQYKDCDKLAIDASFDPACLAVAERVAKNPWQVDLAYACDVGIVNGEPKVIELNAFSTSGLYAVDIPALFKAVSAVAIAEWKHEVSLND